MKKGSKFLAGLLAFLMTLVLFPAEALPVGAIGLTGSPNDYTWYTKNINVKLEKAAPGVKIIGKAFVVGSNTKVDKSKNIGVEVPLLSMAGSEADRNNVKIQGVKINKKYIVRGNIQNLYNVHNTNPYHQGHRDNGIVNWPSNALSYEYCETEGSSLDVVGYDDDYVYIYSKGFASFEWPYTWTCYAWTLKQSHPAGFYKIARKNVLLQLYQYDETVNKKKIVSDAQVMVSRTAAYQMPGQADSGAVYYVNNNETLHLVSKTPVKSKTPKKDGNATYYKCAFLADNDTYFMGPIANKPDLYRVVYVNSKYVNTTTDNKIPDSYARGYVTADADQYVKVYSEKSTSSATKYVCQNKARLAISPAKSTKTWTAVKFNGKVMYILAKYTRYKVSDLEINNVKSNQYVLTWRKIPQKCRIVLVNTATGKTLATIKNVTDNQYTLKDSYFDKIPDGNALTKGITFKIAADYGDNYQYVSAKLAKPIAARMTLFGTEDNTSLRLSSESYYLFQYATNAKFTNAKTQKAAKTGDTKITGLKKNTTYYVRYAYYGTVKTANGTKTIRGEWSTTEKFKTTNYTPYKPVAKTPTALTKGLTAKWAKATTKGTHADGFEVMVATNKDFTKNKQSVDLYSSGLFQWQMTGLKAKTTYYVRVRSYCYCGEKKIYSSWSAVKSVKTK